MKHCNKCNQDLDINFFYKDKAKWGGYHSQCIKCTLEMRKIYYQNNIEEKRKKGREYDKIHRKEISLRRSIEAQKIKKEIFEAYGGPICACCGENNIMFLTLDHVNNDGGIDRSLHGSGTGLYSWLRKNDYPNKQNYQVLCMNCNLGRSLNGGICPHKDKII